MTAVDLATPKVAEASAEPRQTPPMDPALWAQLKAEQTARIQADRAAEAEKMARLTPVTEAELERYGKDFDFYRYDGAGHGFFYYQAPMYRSEQAMDGWEKIFAFFGQHLSP